MPPPATLNFTPADNDLAYKLYQDLIAHGATITDLDVGEGLINYTGPACPKGASTCLVGAHDGRVTANEVFEYALNDYDKYRTLIEGTLQRPLPWVLDDLDPATAFDAKIRSRAQAAIDQLKGILKKQGIQEGTEEYKERMAVGLYYLATLPDAETIRMYPSSPAYATLPMSVKKALGMHELADLGLGEFGLHVKINGGFFVEGDSSEEYTALEALQAGKGDCTEQSKILYALLRMGGLNPQFVKVRRKGLLGSGDPDIEKYLKDLPSVMEHVCIGLELRGQFRLLDPSLWKSNPTYTEYFPHTLRQYFSTDYLNRGAFWANKGEYDKAIADYTRAIAIDPQLAMAYANRGIAWAEKGEFDKAVADYTRAIEIDPQSTDAYNNLGLVFVQTGKLEKALAPLAQRLKLSPKVANVLFSRLSIASGTRWNETIDAKKSAVMFAQETGGGDIAKVEASFLLSYSLWEAGDRAEATVRFTTIADGLVFSQKPSKSTGDFFKTMFHLMPKSMKKDKSVQQVLAKITAGMNLKP